MNIRVMFGPLSDGWPFVGSERCLKNKRERVYTCFTSGHRSEPPKERF